MKLFTTIYSNDHDRQFDSFVKLPLRDAALVCMLKLLDNRWRW